MIRHFSHIFLALGRTFMGPLPSGVGHRRHLGGCKLKLDDGNRLVHSGVVSTVHPVRIAAPTPGQGLKRARTPNWPRRAGLEE